MIVGLQPITVAIFAGVLLGERVTPRHWFGLILGLVGLLLVLGPKFSFGGSGITPLNIAVSVLAMLGQTAGTIYQKKFATGAPLRTGTIWQYVGAVIPSLAYAWTFETFSFTWSGELIFAMAWLVLVLSIAAIFLLMVLIREGSVSRVSSLFYLVPASTAIIAFFLFGETLNAATWRDGSLRNCGKDRNDHPRRKFLKTHYYSVSTWLALADMFCSLKIRTQTSAGRTSTWICFNCLSVASPMAAFMG